MSKKSKTNIETLWEMPVKTLQKHKLTSSNILFCLTETPKLKTRLCLQRNETWERLTSFHHFRFKKNTWEYLAIIKIIAVFLKVINLWNHNFSTSWKYKSGSISDLSSFIFVLVWSQAAFLFCFSPIAFINLISRHCRQLFSAKRNKKRSNKPTVHDPPTTKETEKKKKVETHD